LKTDKFGGQNFPLSDKVKPTCPFTRHDGVGGMEVGIHKFLTCTVWRSVVSFTHWPTVLKEIFLSTHWKGGCVGLRAFLQWL